ncbi:peroxiredoxin family protein [Zeaxanthinibacter enoshimensis]|uniref:peroxiredoxin family protein n=1 Tax=Zeaxanthinibacter enoshimensis TaxID=392009 RepID=UPI00356725E7
MRTLLILTLATVLSTSCKDEKPAELRPGPWHATLEVQDGKELPFSFELAAQDDSYNLTIFNAGEEIAVDEIRTIGDSIIIRIPAFDGYIAGRYTSEEITGNFIKEELDRSQPFSAIFGERPRFTVKQEPGFDVSGIWEATFGNDSTDFYPAKGIFSQEGYKVKGTFRTTTGDYRYLDGVVRGDSLLLSTFDGAHAFLFAAAYKDSVLQGTFYSGNHFQEPFSAKRNEDFELQDEENITYLKEGYDSFQFAFPNSSGDTVSLEDDRYKNKAVIVQLMGSWCPNCLDETRFLVDYLENNPTEGLEIVALAFEYAKTEEKAFHSIKRLEERVGITYPVLLAQYGSSSKTKAQEKLPMLNHVWSYPTTIFIDKKGEVRKIHTGFNGPATGEKYTEFKAEFDSLVKELLSE